MVPAIKLVILIERGRRICAGVTAGISHRAVGQIPVEVSGEAKQLLTGAFIIHTFIARASVKTNFVALVAAH